MEKLKAKLAEVQRKLPWSASLDVCFDDELITRTIDDDFKREASFYNQALAAVKTAVPKLEKLNIPIFRPDDYFAEMNKSDEHMQKVRKRLLDIQTDKKKSEVARRVREERKFASKAQTAANVQKQERKRKLVEAVKSHRKGMKEQLETMLDNNEDWGDDDNEGGGRAKKRKLNGAGGGKMSRKARDSKYGFGGQKKRSKKNDKNSFNDIFEHSSKLRTKKGRR